MTDVDATSGVLNDDVVDDEPRSNGNEVAGPWRRLHPIGWVALGLLVLAVIATAAGSRFLIGNMPWWLWLTLVAAVGVSTQPQILHGARLAIEALAAFCGRVATLLAWVVFALQLFNVVTRYTNSWVEADILFNQVVSLAWMSFGLLFLIGVNYGVMTGINPRIDFWWADFSNRRKAWLDFVMHSFFLLPFLIMSIRILKPYAAASLGYNRFADGGAGAWPSGWRVWDSWEQSPNAGELPVGPIQAFILVAFVLWAAQIVAEMIKTGFIIIGRDDLATMTESDAPLRVE